MTVIRELSILVVPFQFSIKNEISFTGSLIIYIIDQSGDKKYVSLSSGDYFGDISILLGEKRTAGARATTFCETFMLYSECNEKNIFREN